MIATRFPISKVLLIITVVVNVQGRKGVGGSEQDWGHITVRPSAHMFWWLYYTTYEGISNYTDRPLVIWLQGGPGVPSSGFGNLFEIGPLNASFHKREGSFVENFNVLFVDSPVGVGYSYFSDVNNTWSTSGEEIAEDLYNFLQIFINTQHPEFKDVPIHVFGESYGGKMATEFVYKLKLKEKVDQVKFCNVKTLVLGNAYVSPVDYITHSASLALYLGLIDKRGFIRIDNWAKFLKEDIINGKFLEATYSGMQALLMLRNEILGLDMHYFLEKTNSTKPAKLRDYGRLLEPVMNNEIKSTLNISHNIRWLILNHEVFYSLVEDWSKGVTHKIEELLNTTDVKVIVYNGVIDFMVNLAGTVAWLDTLQWHGREKWLYEKRYPLVLNEVSEGYFKKVDNLVLYAILRSGHCVPVDNLPLLNEILKLESLI